MTASDVQYATTSDGVTIAYAVSGRGDRTLIHTCNTLSAQLQFDSMPGRREWIDALGERFSVVRYDSRGTGLSQRECDDLGYDASVLDLEPVIAATAAERVVLFGYLGGSYAASRYAVQHPERVSHLILWPPPIIQVRTPSLAAMGQLAVSDWENFTEMYAHIALGWSKGEHARAYARLMRETVSRETWLRGMGAFTRRPPAEYWAHVSALTTPTLVLQRKNYMSFPLVAGLIPGVKVQMVDGESHGPFVERVDQVLDAIFAFTGVAGRSTVPAAATPVPSASTTMIILFADIADSTALTERIGDSAFREKARALDEGLRVCVRDHGGAVIDAKTLGDGILATFPAASQAIAAALDCGRVGDDAGLPLHLGLHAGDVIRESDNVFGGAVNIAARISALSAAGEVLVSATVRDLGRTSAGVSFEDRGEHPLKGIAEPQRVFTVRKAYNNAEGR